MRVDFSTQHGSAFFGMNSVSTKLFWQLVIGIKQSMENWKPVLGFSVYHIKHIVKNHDMLFKHCN